MKKSNFNKKTKLLTGNLIKKLIALFTLYIYIVNVDGQILISEVLPDPINSETGGEFIELYNNGNSEINIGNWYISTESSERDAILPINSTIKPYSYFLITDLEWQEQKDNLEWLNSDYKNAITMTSKDSGIMLKDKEGNIIDSFGWGNTTLIENNMFEDVTMPNTIEGSSYERKAGYEDPFAGNGVDTNNNFNDFLINPNPSPQSSNSAPEDPNNLNKINLELNVYNNDIIINSFKLINESSRIIPFPGKTKIIDFEYNIKSSANNTNYSINFNNEKIEFTLSKNLSNTILKGKIEIGYYYLGNYSIKLNAINKDTTKEDIRRITIEKISAISIDSNSPSIANLKTGTSLEILGDDNPDTKNKATITNIGNVPINIGIIGSGYFVNKSAFNGNISLSIDSSNFEKDKTAQISNEIKIITANLMPEQSSSINLKITTTNLTREGNYNGFISIIGIPIDN